MDLTEDQKEDLFMTVKLKEMLQTAISKSPIKLDEEELILGLKLAMFGSLAILALLNFSLIQNHHPHFSLELIPGFWALFGLAGAVFLAKAAKGLAHTFLGKDENYYDKYESKTHAAPAGDGVIRGDDHQVDSKHDSHQSCCSHNHD
jgi:hypothetical protein